MRFQRLILSAACVLSLMIAPAFAEVVPGNAAPDFTATDTNGKEVTLSGLKGKPVVLEWTNHECPFVVKHYKSDNMQSIQKYAAEKDAVWISIISSGEGKQGYLTDEEANAVAQEKGATPAHIIRDSSGEIGRLYDAKTTPHMFVIDAEGNVAYAGAIDDKPTADSADVEGATNYVVAALDALAEGNAPEVTQVKPYGCSVKYAN